MYPKRARTATMQSFPLGDDAKPFQGAYPMGKLSGKVALITGGNKGIGKGIARGLAAEGARLTLTARGADELQRTADELSRQGAEVLALPADVTQERQVLDLFGHALERFGRLDVLVNNAGAFD